MSNHGPIYMPGDQVFYTGEKFKAELTNKEGKPLKGWIHSRVTNRPETMVVEFPEAKEADYLIHVSRLSKVKPPRDKQERTDGPEVRPIRRRQAPEES